MKTLRLRAILKASGFKKYDKSWSDVVYCSKDCKKFIYLKLEKEVYIHNKNTVGEKYAREDLMKSLGAV